MPRILAAIVLSLALFPRAATATAYDPQKAGHPMRIAAYALHPAGYLVDRLFFYPLWELGQLQPFRSLFGVKRSFEPSKPLETLENSADRPAS
jgi:hypothetical protein